MLELLAIAPLDGWAFVADSADGANVLRLIRPPYRTADVRRVDRAVLDRACAEDGFRRTRATFANWTDLVDDVTRRLQEAHDALGTPGLDSEAAAEVIRLAPAPVVEHYLERVRTDLLSEHRWGDALTILTDLLDAKAVQTSAELLGRVSHLLRLASDGARKRNTDLCELFRGSPDEGWARAFPDAVAAYGVDGLREVVRDVRRRGSVMAVGA